jgi:peptidoglycan/xylan/chitin deacetylase (PgdA/CDA1 family)
MSWSGIDRWLGGPYESELACMSWDELRRLADAGWEIGSHTHTHPMLTALDGEALDEELRGSREVCGDRLGRECVSLAYPYGEHDPHVVAAAARAGYEAAATLPGRVHGPEPLRWPRVGVYHHDRQWRFRVKISRAVRKLRSSATWQRLARAD